MAYHRWTRPEAERAQILKYDAGRTYADIAARLNAEFETERTEGKVSDAFRKGTILRLVNGPSTVFERSPQLKVVEGKDGSTSVQTNRPFSKEEMAEMFDIDTEQWQGRKIITNTWANNWQTKYEWTPNDMEIVTANWDEMLAEVAQRDPRILLRRDAISPGNLMYQINVFDAHLGMKSWGPETGEDMDLYIGLERFEDAVAHLRGQKPDEAERILFIVGQDLFHFDNLIDGKGGATAKGTPQDVDTRWQKLFVATCEMLREQIDAMACTAMVDVIVSPGNHDTRTTFYAGEYLKAWFEGDERVRIDNEPRTRKYYTFGKVLLGFTHGNNEKKKDLFRIMAEEASEQWSASIFREWHMGHLHHEEVWQDGAMNLRIMRALAATDSWHKEQGYNNINGAQAFTWHRRNGLLQQTYYTVPTYKRVTDGQKIMGA